MFKPVNTNQASSTRPEKTNKVKSKTLPAFETLAGFCF